MRRLVGADAVPETHVFVDVGANHPTHISNTYLFYRSGFRGLLVEPNTAFAGLYRRYRDGDVHLPFGCANVPGVLPFYRQSGSVMDSFDQARQVSAVVSSYAPVLPLDALLACLASRRVFLLSVDCEGFDLAVLQSGAALLQLTDTVIAESGPHAARIAELLEGAGFRHAVDTVHNQIWTRLHAR